MTTSSALLPLVQRYFENDPAQAAHTLETMAEQEAVEALKTMPPILSAQAIRHLNDGFAAVVLHQLPPDLFRDIVDQLDPQQGAAIFLHLSADMRQAFLERLNEKKRRQVQEFLQYPEDSAGRIMTTNFLVFHDDLKVKDAVEKIRDLVQKKAAASYAYVVDKENHLVGVMNMRDLLLASHDEKLSSVVRKDVFTVDSFLDRETVASELSTRRFFAVPVVDSEKRLLGIVKAEQLIGGVQEEATEDLQKMFGAGGDERAFSPISFSLKKRLPWLHVNLATAFLAASVVALFEDLIAKITILAVYLPVVAGQGGNAGAQSLAVVMRGLVMREIPPKKAKTLILKESFIGILGGVVIGIVTAGISWLWQRNIYFGIVIGLGMVVNLAVAGFAGAAIPITMKKIGLDPAQCSNIILTTVTDVMGFFAFLGFAVLFQTHLV